MSDTSDRRDFLTASALMLAAVSLSYYGALSVGFITDDFPQIVDNVTLHSLLNAAELFRQGAWHEGDFTGAYYRPLAFLSWMIEYSLVGDAPLLYHLDNVVLHFLCSVMVYLISLRILKDRRGALFAALLFSLHPANSEAVIWAACRMELMFTLFIITSLWLFISWPRTGINTAASCALYLAGLLSKETAIVLPGLMLCYILLFEEKPRLKGAVLSLLPYIATALAYLALRTAVMGLDSGTSYIFTNYEGYEGYDKFLLICQSFYEYIRLSFLPFDLRNEYIFRPPSSLLSYKVVIPLLLLAVTVLFAKRSARRHRLVYFSAALFLIGLLPVSNIFFPAGVAVTERALYLPSLGPVLLLGALFSKADARRLSDRVGLGSALLAVICVAFIATTHHRTGFWTGYDNATMVGLMKRRVEVFPENPINHMLLGMTYFADEGRSKDAEREALEALRIDPSDDRSHFLYARILKSQRRFGEALDEANAAVSLAPRPDPDYYGLAGGLLRILGRYKEAESMLGRATGLAPDKAGLYVEMGNLCLETGRDEEARALFEKAIKLDPSIPDAYLGIGIILDSRGEIVRAVWNIEKAVELRPDSPDMRYFLASAYLRQGRGDLAEAQINEALRLDPSHEGARQLLHIISQAQVSDK